MKSKKNQGITLIALAVTIIVMLILAGATMSMLTGNSGILTNAKKAKENTRGSDIQEEVNLALSENMMSEYSGEGKKTRAEVINKLKQENKLTEKEVETLGEQNTITIGDVTIDFSGLGVVEGNVTLVEMYRQAEQDGCTNADGLCTNENHLHIGDYVDLKTATTGSITIEATRSGMSEAGVSGNADQKYDLSKNQLNWRVLGINDSGEIELISGSPMKNNNSDKYLYLYSAWAYENGVDILNDICELYKTEDTTGYISTARSVNQDDIDKLTGVTTLELKKQYNLDAYYGEKNIGETYSYADQYTPSSWINGKTTTKVEGKVNGYYYLVNSKADDSAPFVTLDNNRIYKMIFECNNYWLASRFVRGNSSDASFGLGMTNAYDGVWYSGDDYLFGSDGVEDYGFAAVRPVVSLKSEITKQQVPKIPDKIEEEWGLPPTA